MGRSHQRGYQIHLSVCRSGDEKLAGYQRMGGFNDAFGSGGMCRGGSGSGVLCGGVAHLVPLI